jgi:hypothetical protein
VLKTPKKLENFKDLMSLNDKISEISESKQQNNVEKISQI